MRSRTLISTTLLLALILVACSPLSSGGSGDAATEEAAATEQRQPAGGGNAEVVSLPISVTFSRMKARSCPARERPSVHHERVTAHEIGHILGLHHTLGDSGRLMFPGANGMGLTDEESTVARYVASGLLNRVR